MIRTLRRNIIKNAMKRKGYTRICKARGYFNAKWKQYSNALFGTKYAVK